ncbi:unnamed protein product [Spodoptera exigua]|nr:unnamed protein product [Spodoptera exigua]
MPTSMFAHLFSMAIFLTALFVISRAGQNVQNSSLQLRQKLCELCVYTLDNEECYKLAKDLLRCVRTRPVRIHVFGTLDVDMSMLPSIVAFFTTYTVIALQFNNVLSANKLAFGSIPDFCNFTPAFAKAIISLWSSWMQ